MEKFYYYVDVNLFDMKIIECGTATKTRLLQDKISSNIHRVFLTAGQYNKLMDAYHKNRNKQS